MEDVVSFGAGSLFQMADKNVAPQKMNQSNL